MLFIIKIGTNSQIYKGLCDFTEMTKQRISVPEITKNERDKYTKPSIKHLIFMQNIIKAREKPTIKAEFYGILQDYAVSK